MICIINNPIQPICRHGTLMGSCPGAKVRFSFLFLDEYRLIYLGVDKLGIMCYTLVTIKKEENKMYNKLISLINACGNDVYFYQESNQFYITFQDFLGFNDDWEEEMRDYDNPTEVAYLENWLENNCIKKEEDFYTIYFFKDFSVQVDYASYDI